MNIFSVKAFNTKSIKLSNLIYSVVALILIATLLIVSTFSWLMSNFSTSINTSNFISIDADAGLEMNYGSDNDQSAININEAISSDFKLIECSSVDGKNFFFPLSEYSSIGDGDFVGAVSTNDLVFREGTANDINNNYISIDFSLTSASETDVWLSSDTKIYCTDENNTTANALRIAFVENKVGGKTTIFDNSSSVEYAEKNSAVKAVSASGELSDTEACNTRSINEFLYGNSAGNVMFHIDAGETLSITTNIWLEGTDKDCTSSVLGINDLQINVKFTTSYEELRTIYFVDHTLEKWVDDSDCYVFAIDDDGVHHRMTMSENYETDYTWSVDLPSGVENIRFVRYNPLTSDDPTLEWNYWEAGALGDCSIYNAFGHGAGMWANTFSGTTITLFDGTALGFLTNKDDNGLDPVMHVAFDVTDGNGATQSYDYKLSYQNDSHKWQIVIPSEVSDITFKRYDNTETTVYNTWANTERGTNLYYTATASGTGYWSSQLIYLDGYDETNSVDYKSGCTFAAYLYGTGDDVWTAMRAVTTEKGRYIAAVPEGKTGVVFCRMDPNVSNWTDDNVWDYKWNQLDSSLETFGSNNLFIISGYNSSNNLIGTWYYSDNP